MNVNEHKILLANPTDTQALRETILLISVSYCINSIRTFLKG